ncbi:MAG TPA: glutaminyl-peptide cyclotransferase [Candidatus Limnocylindrales bacterium]|nr:glutaminyl-peptide cyclotransferase [Candidatus Limnocylindrales bacterium]
MTRISAFLLTIVCMLVLALPASAQEATPEATPSPEAVPSYEILLPQVVNQLTHSTSDFTQGLVWSDGRLLQSAGRYGQSRIQELDPESGEVLRETPLDNTFFAEGLAMVNDQLVQITWKEQTALIWDPDTFEQVGTFSYDTEGWGLCSDGSVIYMSDGTPNLSVRDSGTFELLDTIPVTLEGQAVPEINELECVDGNVWANIWQLPVLVRIDPQTGVINAIADMRSLLTQDIVDNWANGAVLNGIAYIPERDSFLITGKNWPVMYEVTFVPVEPAPEATPEATPAS